MLILWEVHSLLINSTTDPLHQQGDTQLLVSAHFPTGVLPQRQSHPLGKQAKTREE